METLIKENNILKTYQTSAKTGYNVDEAMNFFISFIINKLENYCEKTGKPLKEDRKQIVLKAKKEKKIIDNNNSNSGCCT